MQMIQTFYIKFVVLVIFIALFSACALFRVAQPIVTYKFKEYRSFRLSFLPNDIAISPNKRFVAISCRDELSIVFIDIDQDHSLPPQIQNNAKPMNIEDYPHRKTQLEFIPARLFFDSTSKYLYAIGPVNDKEDVIWEAKVAKMNVSTGKILEMSDFETGVFARGIALEPESTFAYIANMNSPAIIVSNLETLNVDRKIILPADRTTDISILPNGKAIIGAHPFDGTLSMTLITQSGEDENRRTGRSKQVDGLPLSLVVDKNNKQVIVLNCLDYSLTSYGIDTFDFSGLASSTHYSFRYNWDELKKSIKVRLGQVDTMWINNIYEELILWDPYKESISILKLPSLENVEKINLPRSVKNVTASDDAEMLALLSPGKRLITILVRRSAR